MLQNFASLKISSCSLNWVCKMVEFWSISWYFLSFKTFSIVSFLAFFLRFFTIAGLHIAIPSVNTNLKDTGYTFYRSGVSLKIIVLVEFSIKILFFWVWSVLKCLNKQCHLKANWKIILNHIAADWMIIFIVLGVRFDENSHFDTTLFFITYCIILILFHLSNASDIT